MAYAFTAGQLVNYNRGTPDALMEGIAGKLLSGAQLKFGEIMRMDSYLRQEMVYRQNEIEENEFQKQENAEDKQQLEWERAEIKRYRELAKAEFIAAQRANKQLDTSAAGAVQSTQTFENCILPAQNALEGGDNPMAHERTRVLKGYSVDGKPEYTQVSGRTQDERNDNIVKVYVVSGRIWEFMSLPLAVPTPKPLERSKTDLTEYVWDVYRRFKEKRIRPTTKSREESARNIICRFFEGRYLEDITVNDVQDFINARADEEISRKTINDQLKVLRFTYDHAIEDGLVDKNPAASKHLVNTGYDSEGTQPLSYDEFKRVCACVPNLHESNEQLLLAMLCFTGMRRSEILALRWEDVDFDKKQLRVHAALTFAKGTSHPGKTKSKARNRIIPMSSLLVECLSKYRKDSGQVITDGNGKEFKSDSVYKKIFGSVREQIGLPEVSALVFRSTYATMQAGFEPKTLQYIMGHADIKITMNVYAKVEARQLDAHRETLTDYLGLGISNAA